MSTAGVFAPSYERTIGSGEDVTQSHVSLSGASEPLRMPEVLDPWFPACCESRGVELSLVGEATEATGPAGSRGTAQASVFILTYGDPH